MCFRSGRGHDVEVAVRLTRDAAHLVDMLAHTSCHKHPDCSVYRDQLGSGSCAKFNLLLEIASTDKFIFHPISSCDFETSHAWLALMDTY